MEKIELDNFVLETFDNENMMHRFIAVVLDNDADFNNYVGETKYLVENARLKQDKGEKDSVYVVRFQEEYLGIVSLIILDGKPFLTIGIIPERQGCHYGKNILKEYIEYIFHEYPEYDAIFSSIHPKNERSINNVLKLGFNKLTLTKYVKTR